MHVEILACRNKARADEACVKIKQDSKNEKVEIELVDLASLKSTRDFVERIKTKLDKLDILVNNAGILMVYAEFFTLYAFYLHCISRSLRDSLP